MLYVFEQLSDVNQEAIWFARGRNKWRALHNNLDPGDCHSLTRSALLIYMWTTVYSRKWRVMGSSNIWRRSSIDTTVKKQLIQMVLRSRKAVLWKVQKFTNLVIESAHDAQFIYSLFVTSPMVLLVIDRQMRFFPIESYVSTVSLL
jgi:hypothetical protein